MRIGPVRIIWVILALLAAFVIFVNCLAEVGGGSKAIPKPSNPVPAITPVPAHASHVTWPQASP